MIKIAVCDDCLTDRKQIATTVRSYFTESELWLKEFSSGKGLLQSNVRFDIIFLDIQMPNLNGIETAEKLRKFDINSKIIFLTVHSNYRSKAFRVHAFDYIEKPIHEKEIFQSLSDAVHALEKAAVKETFCFKTESGIVTLKLEEIYYFEYLLKRVTIHSVRGIYTASYSLKELAEKLQKYNFASTHKSFLINMIHVKCIKKFDVYLENGDVIPLAQKRAVQFKAQFNEFLQSTFDYI